MHEKYPSGDTLGVPWARFCRSWVALGRFSGALGHCWGALANLTLGECQVWDLGVGALNDAVLKKRFSST